MHCQQAGGDAMEKQNRADQEAQFRQSFLKTTLDACKTVLGDTQRNEADIYDMLCSQLLSYRAYGLDTHAGKSGKLVVDSSAGNYLKILSGVEGANIYYDIRQGCPVQTINGRAVQWTDRDAAAQLIRIEREFGILAKDKYNIAFNAHLREHEVNPLTDYLDSLKWDGTRRAESFLIKWMGAADTPASRETSRLIFAGGVHRAYEPGCKFDEVAVLIGSQGAGKSTIIQWLAMKPEWYAAARSFEGKAAEESLQGTWIAEIEELSALTISRSRNQGDDSAKAFLTQNSSRFRHAYAQFAEQLGRTCIFIGTTNSAQFLTDLTGNRRYYPVTINQKAAYLYDHREECEEDIRQAWAEMREAYKAGDALANPAPNPALIEALEKLRSNAAIEDWRIGEITNYLKRREKTHILEIWKEALHKGNSCPDMTTRDSREIGQILRNLGWTPGTPRRDAEGNSHKMYYAPTAEKPDEHGFTQVNTSDNPF